MFSKRKSSSPLADTHERFGTLIGAGMRVEGVLKPGHGLRIDGVVAGNIEADSDVSVTVVVGPEGVVEGDVQAQRIIVAGRVTGQINALESLELHASALLQGDVRYATLAVEHGAQIHGRLMRTGESSVGEDVIPSDPSD